MLFLEKHVKYLTSPLTLKTNAKRNNVIELNWKIKRLRSRFFAVCNVGEGPGYFKVQFM